MKIQDILFILLFGISLFLKKEYSWKVGVASFVLAGLLFLASNLFTAQRLSWYAAAFIGLFCAKSIYDIIRH